MPLRHLLSTFRGDTLKVRALRSSGWTFLLFGGQNVLRLASNLVLTRLLFPEAFGMMAIVMVVLFGIEMISDTGVNVSIMQNKRGMEPAFLNTAWTLQILRGLLLFGLVFACADPVAQFYNEPQLAELLPVAGLFSVLLGLQSTNMALVNRNLALGRLTVLELGAQITGILVMILLAWWLKSVWALLVGTLVSSAVKTVLSHLILPGPRNRPGWERAAFNELFHFGKYIFIGSTAGFLVTNADRAILGLFIPMHDLGIYNIGYFLATVPLILSQNFNSRILIPVYAQVAPWENDGSRGKLRRARGLLAGALLGISAVFAITGDWLVDLLYEPDYALAGSIVVLLALAYMPTLLINGYWPLLLAAGDSRTFTALRLTMAVLQTLALYFAIKAYGMVGAIIAPVLAMVAIYPLTARLVAARNGWDPLLDAGLALLAILIAALALWINDSALAEILASRPH